MAELPTGTVTFLFTFTNIAGSTRPAVVVHG